MVGTVTTAPGNGVILYVEGSPQVFATSDHGECTIEFTKADADDIEGSLACEHVEVAAGGHVDFDATFWAT